MRNSVSYSEREVILDNESMAALSHQSPFE